MSPIFELADRYISARVALDPDEATALGVPGYDHLLTNHGPDAVAERAALDRAALKELEDLTAGAELSDQDRVASAFMAERISTRLALHDSGEDLRQLGVLSCPIINIRLIFTLMPTDTDERWETIAQRLGEVPGALESACGSLTLGLQRGLPASRRQALGVAKTCRAIGGSAGPPAVPGWFSQFVYSYGAKTPDLTLRLTEAAIVADAAYARVADWLEQEYAPLADAADGVGVSRYRAMARYWMGSDIDPMEAYDWGWQELDRITARALMVADLIKPGASLSQVTAYLNTQPEFQVRGTDNLRLWLQEFTDAAMKAVNQECFDIPDEIRECEAMIAPPGGAAAMYYTSPSEDFTRPGRTWYPTLGKEVFAIWPAVSTWYHESVPGHHLQIAYAMLQKDRLSRLQRVESISAHAEGWALYAERLMGELGFYSEPAYELGMLSGQALRAARVVVDIGLHLDLQLPDHRLARDIDGVSAVGQRWNRDLAVSFLISHALQEADFAASEVDRYLGLPAQAISYKLGERAWLAARGAAQAAKGDSFDLRAWHMRALALGPVGLDTLATELA